MITQETSSVTLLIFSTLFLLTVAIVTLFWGKKLPGKGSWLVLAGVVLMGVCIGFDSGLFDQKLRIRSWTTGWVLGHQEVGAITVGVFQDPLSLVMSGLAMILSIGVLVNSAYQLKGPQIERVHSALAFSTAGVALAWASSTPWLGFVGIVLTMIGGFVCLGSHWNTNSEAGFAARFISERAVGFLLAFFGVCILACSRAALSLGPSEMWSTQAASTQATWFGSVLLIVGLFVQMQPFPFLGWIVSESEASPLLRTVLTQIFPAWAAFALMTRLSPQLESLGLFPGFGWVALASSALTIFSGLFNGKWRIGLGAWLASGLSLSVALLALSGAPAALAVFLGVSLGAMILSGAGAALESPCDHLVAFKKRARWVKVFAFLGTAAGTGMIGFVSSTGGIRWLSHAIHSPVEASIFLLSFFFFVLLGWKLAWNISRLSSVSNVHWGVLVSFFVWVVLSLGLIWTGTGSGDILPGSPDRLFPSIFDLFFQGPPKEIDANDLISASGVYWGAVILAIVAAYWTSGRNREDQWIVLAEFLPRVSRFLAHGYGVDTVVKKGRTSVIWLGRSAEVLVDHKIWTEWAPRGLSRMMYAVSEAFSTIDVGISRCLGEMLRVLVEIPAKILQLIQTGDLRWYLFFALGSGFALMAHFLRM